MASLLRPIGAPRSNLPFGVSTARREKLFSSTSDESDDENDDDDKVGRRERRKILASECSQQPDPLICSASPPAQTHIGCVMDAERVMCAWMS